MWSDGCPARASLRRTMLRRAALSYADHGWSVVAGACLVGARFSCGIGCRTVACHPAEESWESGATTHRHTIAERWDRRPYSVLLATGDVFDVLEVPDYLGALATTSGPAAIAPGGRWMFFVRAGATLRPELAGQHEIVLHSRGSWVPAPPVRMPHGRVRWTVAPHETGWRLPPAEQVQAVMVAMLPWEGDPYRARHAA
jgi:hypothetical protein